MKKKHSLSAYDEASSGNSSGSDSSSDDSSDDENSASSSPIEEREIASGSSADSDSDDSDAPEDGSTSDEDGSSVSEDENESQGEENEDSGNEDVPLQERVERKEAKGLAMQKVRQRKRSALEVASERLSKLKKTRKASPDDNGTEGETRPKKRSKNAPTEVSSKRSDFFRRGAPRLNESGLGVDIGAHRYKPLDPRTSNLSGHLNEEQFEKNYEFIQGIRSKEIKQLKSQIAARKQTGKKGKKQRNRLNIVGGSLEEDEERLRTLKQEKADFERRKLHRVVKQKVKKKIQDDVASGKRGAYFLKRRERKELELETKVDEIRKRGGHKAVEKILQKRRQKAKSRDANMFVR